MGTEPAATKRINSDADVAGGSPDTPSDAGAPLLRQRLSQFSLGMLLLATACVAVWGSHWMNNQKIEELERRTATMRKLARELEIKDRNHISVIQRPLTLYDQQIWDIYLPDDSLGLHLVTRGISPTLRDVTKTSAGPITTAPLPAGRHIVELRSKAKDSEWLIQVLVDNEPVIAVREPKEVIAVREPKQWNASRGSIGGGNFLMQANLPADQPAVLFSRIFMIPEGDTGSKPPAEPGNGIALWIAQLPAPPKEKR